APPSAGRGAPHDGSVPYPRAAPADLRCSFDVDPPDRKDAAMKRPIFRLAVLLALAPAAASASGVAHRVADLRTQPNGTWYVTSTGFGRARGKALLGFDLPGFGSEPWVSNGTVS